MNTEFITAADWLVTANERNKHYMIYMSSSIKSMLNNIYQLQPTIHTCVYVLFEEERKKLGVLW